MEYMKRIAILVLLLALIPQLLRSDVIVTKQNQKYNGKVIKITDKGFVVRLTGGDAIVIPKDKISKIYRGKELLDLEMGMRYRITVNRPFLPFAILGAASGGYAVKRFRDYQKAHENAENEIAQQNMDSETQNTNDEKKILAESILWGILSVGSFYVALKPVEVKVPIGRLNLSVAPNKIQFALHF
jgi:hypothetical protein